MQGAEKEHARLHVADCRVGSQKLKEGVSHLADSRFFWPAEYDIRRLAAERGLSRELARNHPVPHAVRIGDAIGGVVSVAGLAYGKIIVARCHALPS